jgi:hypothetical protein
MAIALSETFYAGEEFHAHRTNTTHTPGAQLTHAARV